MMWRRDGKNFPAAGPSTATECRQRDVICDLTMRWLAFADSRQERRWEQKQAADQAGLDAAVSIQTLLFPSLVARTVRAAATPQGSRFKEAGRAGSYRSILLDVAMRRGNGLQGP